MREFIVAGLRIQVVEQIRVRGENFPRPAPEQIADYFLIDVFDEAGEPVDLYPHERKSGPNPIQHRMTMGWVGLLRVPVYAKEEIDGTPIGPPIGYRRTGDFRPHFWEKVIQRVVYARVAALLGRRVRDTHPADIDRFPALRRVFDGEFEPPYRPELARSMDDAVADLTGESPHYGDSIPDGTTVNINASMTYSAYQDGATYGGSAGADMRFGHVATEIERGAVTFPLGAIPNGATVTKIDFQFYVSSTFVEAGEGVSIGPYNGTGDDDPDLDSDATVWARAGIGSSFSTDCSAVGSKTVLDLGTTEEIIVQGNLVSPDFVSWGCRGWNTDPGTEDRGYIDKYNDADPPTLTVEYSLSQFALSGSQPLPTSPPSPGNLTRSLKTITASTPIGTVEAVPQPTLATPLAQQISVAGQGIASPEAIGTISLALVYSQINPTGIASVQAVGAHTLSTPVPVPGIPSEEAFGTAWINYVIAPLAIASVEAVPNPVITKSIFYISPISIDTDEAFGLTRVNSIPLIVSSVSVIVFDQLGNKIGGPIYNVVEASATDRLDKIGEFEFTVPVSDERAALLQQGREIQIYADGIGVITAGFIESIELEFSE